MQIMTLTEVLIFVNCDIEIDTAEPGTAANELDFWSHRQATYSSIVPLAKTLQLQHLRLVWNACFRCAAC